MNQPDAVASDPSHAAAPFPGDAEPRVIASTDIFHGDREIRIQHGDQTYRLRITRTNRLILNK